MPLHFTKDRMECVERLEQKNKASYKKAQIPDRRMRKGHGPVFCKNDSNKSVLWQIGKGNRKHAAESSYFSLLFHFTAIISKVISHINSP